MAMLTSETNKANSASSFRGQHNRDTYRHEIPIAIPQHKSSRQRRLFEVVFQELALFCEYISSFCFHCLFGSLLLSDSITHPARGGKLLKIKVRAARAICGWSRVVRWLSQRYKSRGHSERDIRPQSYPNLVLTTTARTTGSELSCCQQRHLCLSEKLSTEPSFRL